MIAAPSYHALGAMIVTLAMFVAFARGRMSVEIVSLMTIAVIAVGLYFFPLPDTPPFSKNAVRDTVPRRISPTRFIITITRYAPTKPAVDLKK